MIKIQNVEIGKKKPVKGCYPLNDGRIYIGVSTETWKDNLINRRNRNIKMYKEEIIPQVLEYLNKNGYPALNAHNFKPKWSQKAGCDCGCSPGFIVDNWELRYKFVSVTI